MKTFMIVASLALMTAVSACQTTWTATNPSIPEHKTDGYQAPDPVDAAK